MRALLFALDAPRDFHQGVANSSPRARDVLTQTRRQSTRKCAPNPRILEKYYASRVNDVPALIDGFEALNAALEERLDRHHQIGQPKLILALCCEPCRVGRDMPIGLLLVRRTRDQGGQMSRMRWSQLKTALGELCAPELRSRVALHQARYRYTREEVGRVWVTIDGREVASFDTMSYIRRRSELGAALLTPQSGGGETSSPNAHFEADEKARAALRASGQYDDYEALADLEAYLSMGVDAALRCPSPLVRALAVIDRRVGKRTLRKLAVEAEHQLVRELYLLRCAAEGIDVAV